jgi:hypothetical protein
VLVASIKYYRLPTKTPTHFHFLPMKCLLLLLLLLDSPLYTQTFAPPPSRPLKKSGLRNSVSPDAAGLLYADQESGLINQASLEGTFMKPPKSLLPLKTGTVKSGSGFGGGKETLFKERGRAIQVRPT